MFEIEWYVDLPGRHYDLCSPGQRVWVDIEPGCFTIANDVRKEGSRLTDLGLSYGTYGNHTSIFPVFGNSEELGQWPLWYADYRAPIWSTFEPFNGFLAPKKWQFDDHGLAGINVDLSVDYDGLLWADFGNYTILSPKTADMLVAVCSGAIIGLQDEGRAQWNFEALKAAVGRFEKHDD